MSRAVMTAFLLYSGVAIFAAYEARVIASRAERDAPTVPAVDSAADGKLSVETALNEAVDQVRSDTLLDAGDASADSVNGPVSLLGRPARPSRDAEPHRTTDPIGQGGR